MSDGNLKNLLGPLTQNNFVAWMKVFRNQATFFHSAGQEAIKGKAIKFVLEEAKSHLERPVLQADGKTYKPEMVPWDASADRGLAERNRLITAAEIKHLELRGKLWAVMTSKIGDTLMDQMMARARVKFEKAQAECKPHLLLRIVEKVCLGLNETQVTAIQLELDRCYQKSEPYDTWTAKFDDLVTRLEKAGKKFTNGDKVIYFRDRVDIDLVKSAQSNIFSLSKTSKALPAYDSLRKLVLKTWTTLQARINTEKALSGGNGWKSTSDKPKETKGQQPDRAPKRKSEDDQSGSNKRHDQVSVLSVKTVKAVMTRAGISFSQEQAQRLGTEVQLHKKQTSGKSDTSGTKSQPSNDRHRNLLCFNCDKTGHAFYKCKSAQARCDTCNEPGHLTKHCEACSKCIARYQGAKAGGKNKKVASITVDASHSDLQDLSGLHWEECVSKDLSNVTLGDFVTKGPRVLSAKLDSASKAAMDTLSDQLMSEDDIEAVTEPINDTEEEQAAQDRVSTPEPESEMVVDGASEPTTDVKSDKQDCVDSEYFDPDGPNKSEDETSRPETPNLAEVRAAEELQRRQKQELDNDPDYQEDNLEEGEVSDDNSEIVSHTTRSRAKLTVIQSSPESSASSSGANTPRRKRGKYTSEPEDESDGPVRTESMAGWPDTGTVLHSGEDADPEEERQYFSMDGLSPTHQMIVHSAMLHTLQAGELLVQVMRALAEPSGPDRILSPTYRACKNHVYTFARTRMGDNSKPSQRSGDNCKAFSDNMTALYNGIALEMAHLRERAEPFDSRFHSERAKNLFVYNTGMLNIGIPISLRNQGTSGNQSAMSPESLPEDGKYASDRAKKAARNKATKERKKASKQLAAEKLAIEKAALEDAVAAEAIRQAAAAEAAAAESARQAAVAAAAAAAEAARRFSPMVIPDENPDFTRLWADLDAPQLPRVENEARFKRRLADYKVWCSARDIKFVMPDDCRKPSSGLVAVDGTPVSPYSAKAAVSRAQTPVTGNSPQTSGSKAKSKTVVETTKQAVDLTKSSPDEPKLPAKSNHLVFKPQAVRPEIKVLNSVPATSSFKQATTNSKQGAKSYATAAATAPSAQVVPKVGKKITVRASSPDTAPPRTLDLSGTKKAVATEVKAGSRRTESPHAGRRTPSPPRTQGSSRQHDEISRTSRPKTNGYSGTVDQRLLQVEDELPKPKPAKRKTDTDPEPALLPTPPPIKRSKADDAGPSAPKVTQKPPVTKVPPKPAPKITLEYALIYYPMAGSELLEFHRVVLPGNPNAFYACENIDGTPLREDEALSERIDRMVGYSNVGRTTNLEKVKVLYTSLTRVNQHVANGCVFSIYHKVPNTEVSIHSVRHYYDENGELWIILDSGAAVHVARNSRVWHQYRKTDRSITLTSASGGKIKSEEVGWVKGMGIVVTASMAEQDLLSIYQLCRSNPFVRITFAGAYAKITHPLLLKPLWAKAGAEDQFLLRPSDFDTLQEAMGTHLTSEQQEQFHRDNDEVGPGDEPARVASAKTMPDISALSLTANVPLPAEPPAGTLQAASGHEQVALSKEQRVRAAQVNTLHNYLGHPSDDVLINSLNSGVIVGTALTASDVRNCRTVFGDCMACKVGKISTEPHYTSLTPPTTYVGERVYMDIIPLGDPHKDGTEIRNASDKELIDQLGGYKYLLLCVDSYSNFLIATRIIVRKTPENVMNAFDTIKAEFTRHNHKIGTVIFDSEPTLLACNTALGKQGIIMGATQPHLHNRRVERQVQTIKQRIRALRASSQVVFPDALQGELWQSAIYSLNDVLNSNFQAQTPRMLFEGTKTDLTKRSLIPVGTVVMVPQPEDTEQRAALGVCLRPSQLTYCSNVYYMMGTERLRVAKEVSILKFIPDSFPWKVKAHKEQFTTQNKHRKKKTRKTTPTDGPVAQAVIAQRQAMANNATHETTTEPPMVISGREGNSEPETSLPSIAQPKTGSNMSEDTEHTGTEGATYIASQSKRPGVTWTVESAMQAAIQGNLLQKTQAAIKRLEAEKATLKSFQDSVMNEVNISPADVSVVREALVTEQVAEGVVPGLKTNKSKTKPPLAPGVKGKSKPKTVAKTDVPMKRSERLAGRKERKVLSLMRKHDSARVRKACRIFKISVKESLRGEHAQESKEAIIGEIQNMLQYRVGHYIRRCDIPTDKLKNILQSFMFLKHKTLPDGSYDKTKARMVGNGATQQTHMYDMVSSSTVALASVFLLVNIASFFKTKITTYDIKGAFLHAGFGPEDEVTYIRINKEITALWIKQDPTAEPFVDDNGTLLLELDKFIYGLKQSPLKFQQHLSGVLLALGYERTTQDDCVYMKHEGEAFSILSTHVDDILQVATSEHLYKELKDGLIAAYGEITTSDEGEAYLGMSIDRAPDRKRIKLSQRGLIDKILKAYPRDKGDLQRYYSPSSDDLFKVSGDTSAVPLPEPQRREFLSALMSLMYCARLTRPDILMPVTFLAGRAHCATDKDWSHLMRVIRYLENEPDLGVYINCDSLQIKCKCDASYVTHTPETSAYGHTGYIISLGDNMSYVHGRSGKQKLASTASTDAEIIAMCEALKTCMWLRELLRELHITDLQEVVVFQDNLSAITLGTVSTTPKRSKHMLPKLTYVRSLELSGAVRLEYLSTTEMTADVLSKPLHGEIYYQHVDNMMGLAWSDKKVLHKMGSKRKSPVEPSDITHERLGRKKPKSNTKK